MRECADRCPKDKKGIDSSIYNRVAANDHPPPKCSQGNKNLDTIENRHLRSSYMVNDIPNKTSEGNWSDLDNKTKGKAITEYF